MDNETKIKLTFSNSVRGEKKLERYEERLKNIYGLINGLNSNETQGAMGKINKDATSMNKTIKETSTSTIKLGNNLNKAFNIAKIAMYTRALFKLTQQFAKLSQKSVEYIENVNLLQVAYKNQNEEIEESSKRIQTYIDKMSEVYGFDESSLTRKFGIFKQLANAMQLPTETAENLSELMVKMSNDIASLYNLPLDRASNALQSALAGQVRPIRSATGADITEKTLQNTVDALGLDRTINQLSYVEKRLIMVISLTQQLKNSQGDYARTIESASNQIRVMKEQWDRLSRAVGNVFYPILEQVLPYVNAILMVLTEIFNLIASLVGYKMPEFDYEGLTGVSDLAQDIEDEMNGAGDATDALASKLKGLRSFDKLNVISTPSSSSSSSSVGVGNGYIDPKIMEAFNTVFSNYNDMMDTVQMRATKIRDRIMEWLGFTKEIDEETGEISWKYEGLGLQIDDLLNALKTTGEELFGLYAKLGEDLYKVFTSDVGQEAFNNIYEILVAILEIVGNITVALNEAFSKDNIGYESLEAILIVFNDLLVIVNDIGKSLKKWTASKSFKDAIKGIAKILNDILKLIKNIADWIVNVYQKYLSPLVDDILILISEIINAIEPIWDIVYPIISKIIDIILKYLEPVLAKIIETIDDIIVTLTGFMQFISGIFTLDWKKAWQGIQNIFGGFYEFTMDSVGILTSFFTDSLKSFEKVGEDIGNSLVNIFSNTFNKIKDVIKIAWDAIKNIFKNPGEFFSNVGEIIKNAFVKAFENIKTTISNIWGNILKLFSNGGKIFDGFVDGVASVFKNIVNGLIDGINWAISQPFNKINGILNDIRDFNILGKKPFAGLWGYNPIWVPQIPKLALGGIPEVGQLFVANEQGAELVGHIGGQTFVANQNQMMDLLDKKIGNAQSNKSQVFNIYLDAEHKIGTYTLDQLESLAKTNGSAITIGG